MTTISHPPSTAHTAGASPVLLGDAFRDVLVSALIARHREEIRSQPELMFMRSTWDPDEWARAEADTLLVHIRTALERAALQPRGPA